MTFFLFFLVVFGVSWKLRPFPHSWKLFMLGVELPLLRVVGLAVLLPAGGLDHRQHHRRAPHRSLGDRQGPQDGPRRRRSSSTSSCWGSSSTTASSSSRSSRAAATGRARAHLAPGRDRAAGRHLVLHVLRRSATSSTSTAATSTWPPHRHRGLPVVLPAPRRRTDRARSRSSCPRSQRVPNPDAVDATRAFFLIIMRACSRRW